MANNFVNLSSLDFETLKTELTQYLVSKEEFTDVDIKGTNWNFTMDLHAYITQYMSFLANQSVNEPFIDTVAQRRNMMSIAKMMSNPVRRAVPATITVSVALTNTAPVIAKFPTFDTLVDNLVLPAYSVFSGSEGSTFITIEDYIFNDGNNFTENVVVYEGSWVQGSNVNETDGILLGTGTGTDFQISHIFDNSIANTYTGVYVNGVLWENEQIVTYIESGDLKYQILEDWTGEYNIYFGGSNIGTVVPFGEEIRLKYISTNGAAGNNKDSLRLIGSLFVNGNDLYEVDNVAMTTLTTGKTAGGADRETIEEVRATTPRFWASQDRGVINADYWALLSKHELIEYVSIWGGENASPPQYGVVYATIKPYGADTLTSAQIDTLTTFMKAKTFGGIRLKFLNPVYIMVPLAVSVEFNQTYGSSVTINSQVNNAINAYFQNLYDKSLDFRASNLSTAIDDVDGVESNTVDITTYMKVFNNVSGIYYFKIGQAIKPSTLVMTLAADSTKGWYDDGLGNIKDKLTDETIGLIEYTEGIISVTDYSDIPLLGFEKLYVELESKNIKLYNNVMFSLSSSESTITSVAV